MVTDISQLDFNKKYAYSDYLKWKVKERLELIKGYVYKMSPAPARRHQYTATVLTSIVYQALKESNCGVYAAPFDVRLRADSNDTVVQPDLCVICDKNKLDDQGCNGAPDLIVEILSPGNTDKEMKLKYELYEENGVQEYWIVDTEHQYVLINVLNKGSFQALRPKTSSEMLTSTIFPQMSFLIDEIFEK